MKNLVLIFALALTVGILSGCQTTQGYKDQIATLNSRVQTLESTVEQRDREIADLQDQIDATSEKKSTSSSTTVAADSKDHLGIIRVGVPVADVQKALQAAGYYSGNIDGKIGPNTIAGIAGFQKANGLKADSIVGAKTWDALKSYLK